MASIALYHVGFERIPNPDVRFGRKNADFGQGFYLSNDLAFSTRWARYRRGRTTWLNAYALNLEGLSVRRLNRDAEWVETILNNRSGAKDACAGADVVIGPIANDTLYDVWGLAVNPSLTPEQSLQLLCVGPWYVQYALKTDRAAANLTWVSSRPLSEAEIEAGRALVAGEEAGFQTRFAERLSALLGLDDATD